MFAVSALPRTSEFVSDELDFRLNALLGNEEVYTLKLETGRELLDGKLDGLLIIGNPAREFLPAARSFRLRRVDENDADLPVIDVHPQHRLETALHVAGEELGRFLARRDDVDLRDGAELVGRNAAG